MNEFIEKNKGLLHFFCVLTRIVGWLLLVFASIMTIVTVIKILQGSLVSSKQTRPYFYILYMYCQQLVLTFMLGLVLLGLVQFVIYLYESGYQPGLLFHHGNKVLYIYAATLIISPILHYFLQMTIIQNSNKVFFIWPLLPMTLPSIAKGLIFIGIAQILQRTLPIIEESKTLV